MAVHSNILKKSVLLSFDEFFFDVLANEKKIVKFVKANTVLAFLDG